MLLRLGAGLSDVSKGKWALSSGKHLSDVTMQAVMYAKMCNTVEIKIRRSVVFMTRILTAVIKGPVSRLFLGSGSPLKASVLRINLSATFVRNLLNDKL
jgi:hypothetical protein